ncbi:MAG TPA: hypothetical protein VM367_04825 [Pseudonocardia sp.]|jgi:hypothetical protein|nr:hypothetical protein [Pseudonocardia sp.]
MKITTHRTMSCPDERTCPSIHTLDRHPDRRYLITKVETDSAITAAFAHLIGPGEQLGWAPAELLPEVGP